MADIVSKDKRSFIMSQIKSKNTKPEVLVRKFLFSHGYRFRLHSKNLPGSPDIVLKKYKTVILVQGCFWHYHNPGCRSGHIPNSNKDFWEKKIKRNIERDKENIEQLNSLGWNVLVVWECELAKRKQEATLKAVRASLNNL